MQRQTPKIEWCKCNEDVAYFIDNYVQIYDAVEGDWISFNLWPVQFDVVEKLESSLLLVILKARQEGLTWLILSYILWLMIFRPVATALLFSRRDREAVYMLTGRLKEMYKRLPRWMQARSILQDNDHEWRLSNGSEARAFPTTAGDSYTATIVLVDEADLVPDLNQLMRAVKPTIDAGGRMILLSRADKSKPESEFKKIYRAARQKITSWSSIFLPWYARPDRTDEWYEAQKVDIQARTGSLDDLYEQYPATDTEALSPRVLDKRISPLWLEACFSEKEEIFPVKAPAIPGLVIYEAYVSNQEYCIGADLAEGNPTSNDSALTVIRKDTGEEVAKLSGKYQPSTFAAHVDAIGIYYGFAAVMPERNNHGHAFILWLQDNSPLEILRGHDGKPGWLSSSKGKTILYDAGADAFRHKETMLHTFETYTQLASVEGSTLRAPEGLPEDLADSYCLVLAGLLAPGGLHVGTNPMAGYRG
ncbi:hypothetical protein LCGC14_0561710 [marine sediment metagenome]|uniref:Terminase large subunit gp17-like C-terminal domain-containing protein n=1 Tax=marine sediment metagenome TaxID=412755 RepID=A0A0F9RRY9_9ZZZZ